MVAACAGAVDPTALALVAAAHQTGGRVVCILRGNEELDRSEELILGALGVCHVEFVIGEARNLLLTHYRDADFALIDCNLDDHEAIIRAVQMVKRNKSVNVVGYNALRKGSWRSDSVRGWRTQLLPIGEGLLVTRLINHNYHGVNHHQAKVISGVGKRSPSSSHSWIVKVDKCTGEEHVFRVRSPLPHGRQIEA